MKVVYVICAVLVVLCGGGSLYFVEQERSSDEQIHALSGSWTKTIVVDADGDEHVVDESEANKWEQDGFKVHPRIRELEEKASTAEELGISFLFVAIVAGCTAAGLLGYSVFRLILDRFVEPKWSFLLSGLLCLGTGFLMTGVVRALIDISKLPKKGAPGRPDAG